MTTRGQLVDGEARRRIANDLASTFVVEAAAGTGKTTALVERVLSLLRTGAATLASGKGDLVAVTFTEKAAGEMKLRLRTEIERTRTIVDSTRAPNRRTAEMDRLDSALEQLEAARIGTIHAFCADILRERPVEAEIDPLFEVAAEDEQDRLYDEAFTQWFQATLARPAHEVPGVSRVLRRATRERDQEGPKAALRRAGRTLVEQRDFPTPYARPDFDRAAALDEVVVRLHELAELAPKGFPDSWLTKSLVEVGRVVYEIRRREENEPRDHDSVEAQLRTLLRSRAWGWKGSGQWFNKAEAISRQEVLDRRAAAREHLARVLDSADADLAASLFGELWGIVEIYEAIKRTSGKLDFLDLLVLTRDLLKNNAAVRGELQRRFSHLLVDEFQDTDPLQAEILFLLAADDPEQCHPDRARVIAGKLFLVGDPKQSIYRFRRADVSLYESIKERLTKDGAEVLRLVTTFRSAPSIQEFVNAAFAPLMPQEVPESIGRDGEPRARSQAAYVPLAPHRPEKAGRPTIVALPVPRPYGDYRKIVHWKIEESLPDAVGAFIDWMIKSSGWTVTERGSAVATPIRPVHVCLLFKRLQSFGNDVTRPYVRALEARRIPHVLVGGRSFHEREEVIALRNALAAIEWPDDVYSVYATLHGPFFAIADDALLAFRHSQRHLHPLRKRDESTLTDLTRPVPQALEVLARLHAGRNRRTVADTIAQLLENTRAHAGVAIWPSGEQALGNILRVLDMARRFEQGSITSFRAFVSRLEEDAERGGVNEAPVVEEGTDGVRIMTVHKAKGLEFRRRTRRTRRPRGTSTRSESSGRCRSAAHRRRSSSNDARTSSVKIARRPIASFMSPRHARASCSSCPCSVTIAKKRAMAGSSRSPPCSIHSRRSGEHHGPPRVAPSSATTPSCSDRTTSNATPMGPCVQGCIVRAKGGTTSCSGIRTSSSSTERTRPDSASRRCSRRILRGWSRKKASSITLPGAPSCRTRSPERRSRRFAFARSRR